MEHKKEEVKVVLSADHIAMRDACFHDVTHLIKLCIEDTPTEDGKNALRDLGAAICDTGVDGFGIPSLKVKDSDNVPCSVFEFLRPADGPVVEGMEEAEVVYAKDQPEYIPLRTLPSNTPERRVLSRWTLTDDQRKLVLAGADIYLELMTFSQPLQPIRMGIGIKPDAKFIVDLLWPHDGPESNG